ncbi:MAG: phosphatidate cytidylyltransferase [Planctomycetes bacterium]|nr:phosphatidate cytidylyltransferase [Planctomycetota bacterium]
MAAPTVAPPPPRAPAPPAKPSLLTRCASGGVALVLLFAVYLIDAAARVPWLSLALAVAIGTAAAAEFHWLLQRGGWPCRAWLGASCAALLLAGKSAALLRGMDARPLVEAFFGAYLILLLALEVLAGNPAQGLRRASANLLGFAYILLYSFLLDVLLRPLPPAGVRLTLFLVLVAKASDIGGYLTGSVAGGPKLVPRISPGKTWSGTAGGLALAAAVALIGGRMIAAPVHQAWWLLFGVVVGLTALLGDLAESLLKRACQAKDSSVLVPTFGGVLDVVDSLVLAAPVGYWFLVWLAGVPS